MPVTIDTTTTLTCDLCAAVVRTGKTLPSDWWGATSGGNAIGMLGLTRGPESSLMTKLVICPECIEPLLVQAGQLKQSSGEARE